MKILQLDQRLMIERHSLNPGNDVHGGEFESAATSWKTCLFLYHPY
jgi:hypothetical protein